MPATAPDIRDDSLVFPLFQMLAQRFPGSRWDLLEFDGLSARLLTGAYWGEPPGEDLLARAAGPLPLLLERDGCSPQLRLELGDLVSGGRLVEAAWPLEEGRWVLAQLDEAGARELERRKEWVTALLGELSNGPESPGAPMRDFHSILHHPSSPLVDLLDQLERIARSETQVFLEGESGVGKELFARALHQLSERRQGAFVAQNGGALTETLIESELFGHSRGSFTGAREERVGLFELAHGGSFFLDEVGDLSPMLQVRLLRVLQEKSIRRVGENRMRPVDFRLISATHRDMRRKIDAGEFREDLWFRISGFRLRIPPLRERPMDIPVLAESLLRSSTGQGRSRMRRLSPGASLLLQRYGWPGNVRELQNEIARVLALYSEHPVLERWMLSEQLFEGLNREAPLRLSGISLQEAQEDLERRMIRRALLRFQGNRSASARALGLSRQGLLKKLKRLDLEQVALE